MTTWAPQVHQARAASGSVASTIETNTSATCTCNAYKFTCRPTKCCGRKSGQNVDTFAKKENST